MADDINEAVEQVLSAGLENASETEILRQLDAELQQQTQARAMVLGAEEPAPWVLGGESAGGFGSMVHRFIGFYSDALRREICDSQAGGLKQQYRDMIGGQTFKDQIKAMTPVVLKAIGGGDNLSAPATIAAMLALWLA